MVVGDNLVAGTMLFRLCMLPGLVLLVWAAPRIARHVGASGPVALWICALNPLVIIHPMGGVHNEMLMVGLMMAGIALTFARHHIAGAALIAVAVAVKATAGLALPFMVWVWMRHLSGSRLKAFLTASATSVATFIAVFALLSWSAGVGLGWLTALAGSVKIINWLTIPTATANLISTVGGWFGTVNFYAVLEVTRLIGAGIILVSLPVLWWRFRHTDREGAAGHFPSDGGGGAVRSGCTAVVLHLAAGSGVRAGPVALRNRAGRRLLDMDHGDLQTGRITRHVLVAARAAGNGMRCGGVVLAAQRGTSSFARQTPGADLSTPPQAAQ